MADKNVVRRDVVEIGFEVDSGGFAQFANMIKKMVQSISDFVDEFKGMSETTNDITGSFKDISKGVKEIKSDGIEELGKAVKETAESAADAEKRIYDMSAAFDSQDVREVNELSKDMQSSATAAKNFTAALKANTVPDLKKDLDKVERTVKDVNNSTKSWQSETEGVYRYSRQIGDGFEDALPPIRRDKDETEQLTGEIRQAGSAAGRLGDGFTVVKGIIANIAAQALASVISKVKELTKSLITTGMDFEASMSEVKAISGAAGDDFELLKSTAEEFGKSSVFSASEAAQALKYMSLASWDAKQSSSALGGVLDLAAASGMDLAAASDMVTDYLSAFGMAADRSSYFADLLAYAQANANTSVVDLGEAYRNSAANLSAAGQDIETVTSLLSMMANQGLKGSEAGTALSAAMRDITAKMKDGAIKIGDVSVKVSDTKGNFRDLTDILKDVEKATDGMGDAQKAVALSSTFTADSIRGLNLILSAGVGAAADFEEELRHSNDTAKNMSETMNDNLAGDIKALQSQFEAVQNTIFKKFNPALRQTAQYAKSLLGRFEELIKGAKSVKEAGEGIGRMFADILADIGGLVPGFFETGAGFIQGLLDGMKNRAGGIGNVLKDAAKTIANDLPDLTDSGAELITGFVSGIADNSESITETVLSAVFDTAERISDHIGDFINAGADLVTGVVKGIFKSLSEMLKSGIAMVKNLIMGIVNSIPKLLESGKEIVKSITDGIKNSVPVIVEGARNLINDFVNFIKNNLGDILQSGAQLVLSLMQGMMDARESIFSAAIDIITSLIDGIEESLPTIVEEGFKAILQFVVGIIKSIPKLITSGVTLIGKLISGIIKALPKLYAMGLKLPIYLIKAIFETDWLEVGWDIIKGIGEGVLEGAKSVFTGIGDFIKGFFSGDEPEGSEKHGDYGGSGGSFAKKESGVSDDMFSDIDMSDILGDIENDYLAQSEDFKDLIRNTDYSAEMKEALDTLGISGEMYNIAFQNEKGYSDGIKSGGRLAVNSVADIQAKIKSGFMSEDLYPTGLDTASRYAAGFESGTAPVINSASDAAHYLNDKFSNTEASASDMAANVKKTAASVTNDTNKMSADTKSAVANMGIAMRDEAVKIKNSVVNTFNAMKNTLDRINLYDTGVNIMRGLRNGMLFMQQLLLETAESIAANISAAVNSTLKIASPSKVMMETGRFVDMGLIEGMKQEMPLVTDTSAEIGRSVNTGTSDGIEMSGNPFAAFPSNNISNTSASNVSSNYNISLNMEFNGVSGNDQRKIAKLVEQGLRQALENAKASSPSVIKI